MSFYISFALYIIISNDLLCRTKQLNYNTGINQRFFAMYHILKDNMFKALFEIEIVATDLKNKQRDVPR